MLRDPFSRPAGAASVRQRAAAAIPGSREPVCSAATIDMTPLELIELALARDQEHAMIVLDAQGTVVSWLAGAQAILGYSADEMVGQTLEKLFTPEDLQRGVLDWEFRAARSYGKAEDDRWLVRKDGMRIWVSGALSALRAPNGEIVAFSKILRDRTDVRMRLELLQSRLEQA